ncbi:unknown [Akkermansia sp. CAG:344]|nr:unknown [Akkermansia sp. CAG:344]
MSLAFTIFSALRKFWPGPASFPRDHMITLGWFLLRSTIAMMRSTWAGIHSMGWERDSLP